MEKFFLPKNEAQFVNWLLKLSNENRWIIVLEYSEEETYKFLIENATEVTLPITTEHHYDKDCRLTAITNPVVNERFVNTLSRKCSVLSVHDKKEMIFLIADDFHEECFSCTVDFFKVYYQVLKDLNLIYINQENEKTRFEL